MMKSHPVLSDELRSALDGIGGKLERRRKIGDELQDVVELLNRLDPGEVAKAESEIVAAANLFHVGRVRLGVAGLFSSEVNHFDQLERSPGLEFLFVFHRDGRLREAALQRITGGLASPFLVAALAWRLNDWASQVRAAAVACAARTFPLTSAAIIGRAAMVLLQRRDSWRRWDDEREVLDAVFDRPDVARSLSEMIMEQVTGPAARVLGSLLKRDGFDRFLEVLAHEAVQPAVRALAAKTLIHDQASWQSGWEWKWIDKASSYQRRVPTYSRRMLGRAETRVSMVRTAANDRSAVVRKIALDGLIQYQVEGLDAREIAASLLHDRSRAVRERAEYVMKSRGAAP